MGVQRGPLPIVSNGLVGCWDAASKRSYPGSGTLWKDISGQGNDATVNSAPVFVNQNGGYLNFDGTDDYFTYDLYSGFDNAYIQSISVSVEAWVRASSLSGCCGAFWASGQRPSFRYRKVYHLPSDCCSSDLWPQLHKRKRFVEWRISCTHVIWYSRNDGYGIGQ